MRDRAQFDESAPATARSARRAAPGDAAPRLAEAAPEHWLGSNADPDVLLSVPELTVDRLALKVKELQADIDVQVRVLDLLDLRVGAHVSLAEVDLEIDGVAAQAMLKVRLDDVAAMVEQVLAALGANPALASRNSPVHVVEGTHRVEHGPKPPPKRAPRKSASGRRDERGA
jgi:uncharacterized protein involved in outer membrane biogenesis